MKAKVFVILVYFIFGTYFVNKPDVMFSDISLRCSSEHLNADYKKY